MIIVLVYVRYKITIDVLRLNLTRKKKTIILSVKPALNLFVPDNDHFLFFYQMKLS